MKKIFTLVFVLLANFSIFASSGIMWNQKNLKVSKTKWFDIIYPEICQESANLLYKNADSIYEEIAKSYGYPISVRMPVVITPAVENFNAYWTAYPYNHIVLYDTYPIKELEVFSQSFLSTFKHELTHAYTYNLRSDFFQAFSKIFGDAYNPGFLFITSGWAEGATLTSESSTGEGRLNNEYAKHTVKQAKIEGEFPLYEDVQGSRDLYPSGSFYYFNGAFDEYLQKTFGMKAYANFWYDCINLKSISLKKIFKNNFGENLNKTWLDFYSDVEVPEVKANPVKSQIVKDYFEIQSNDFSKENNSGALYSNLVSSEKGIYFLNQKNDTIYFQDFNDFSSSSKNFPKKLLNFSDISSFNVSQDGRFLALNILSSASANPKSIIKIFDTQKKSFFTLKETSLYSPSIIKANGEYFLIFSSYKSPVSLTNISKIKFSKSGKIKSLEKVFQKEWKLNQNVTNYCDLGSGNFVFLQRSGLSYSLLIMSSSGEILKSYKVPQGISVRNLAVFENKVYFSFVKDKTLPRSAYFDFDEEKFVFSTKDISGGIFYQAKFVLGQENFKTLENQAETSESKVANFAKSEKFFNKIFYTAEFYRQSRLLIADEKNLYENSEIYFADSNLADFSDDDFETLSGKTGGLSENFASSAENVASLSENFANSTDDFATLSGEIASLTEKFASLSENSKLNGENLAVNGENSSSSIGKSENQIPSKKYNPLPYYLKGLLYPASTISSKTFIPGSSSTYNLPYGLTYISSNPWTTDFLTLSLGYGTQTNSFGAFAGFQSGTGTSLLNYEIKAQTEFTFSSWRTSDAQISVSSAIPFAKNSYFILSANNFSHIGKANKLLSVDEPSYYTTGGTRGNDQNIYFYTANSFGISYSNIHATKNSKYEKAGFSLSPLLYYYFNQNISEQKNYQNQLDLGLNFKTYIPRLLPLENNLGLTYNLPTKIKIAILPQELANLYDSPFYFSGNDKLTLSDQNILAAARLETVLFAVDIQKAFRLVNLLYMNDLSISFIYTCAFSESQESQSGNSINSANSTSSNWRFLRLNDYFEDFKNQKLTFSYEADLRFLFALTPNFGTFANSGNRMNFYVDFGILSNASQSSGIFVSSIGLESRF